MTMQTTQTIALVSIAAVGEAVKTVQVVDGQLSTLQATKKAAYGVIGGAVQQNAKAENVFLSLREICDKICIPATIGRLRRMEQMQIEWPSLDWAHAFSNTTEDAMTDKNKTSAYNAAKMALSRMKKAEEKAAEESANEAAQIEAAQAQAAEIQAAEQKASEAFEAAKQADEAKIAAEQKANEAASQVAELEAKLFAANARIAELEADNATLTARLEATSSKGKSRKQAAHA